MNAAERLAEYRSADELLLRIVAREVRRGASKSPGSHLPAVDRGQVTDAVNIGLHRVIRWRAGQDSRLGLVARHAVADVVAAEAVRSRFPSVAAQLECPWRTAVQVRNRLRNLGSDAEEVALRLLPTWQLPLEELPDAAAALTWCPERSEGRPPSRRRA